MSAAARAPVASASSVARANGAVGGKLVGAGGGGFLLVYSAEPGRLREAMYAAGADEVRFGFDFHGVFGQEYA